MWLFPRRVLRDHPSLRPRSPSNPPTCGPWRRLPRRNGAGDPHQRNWGGGGWEVHTFRPKMAETKQLVEYIWRFLLLKYSFFCLKRQSSKWSRSYFNMDVQGVQHWIEWNVRHWLAFFTIQDSVWVRWKNLKSIGCIGVWCNVQRTRQNPNLITAHLFRDLWNRSNQQPASSRLDASHDAEQAHPCLHGIYYICTCIEWILKSWWCGKTTVFWSCKLPGLEFFIALMKMCGCCFHRSLLFTSTWTRTTIKSEEHCL